MMVQENIVEGKSAHNVDMNLAWQFIAFTNISVFLTGKAGTGKTTFLRHLRELTPKRMVVLAPTGVAAINAQGQTIHSFFQLPFGPNVPGMETAESKRYSMSKEKKALIRSLDLLVIDEISMVRCDLLDAVDREMRKYRDRTKPFGGVQLLLIGDLQQLAPVAKDDEWALLQPYYSTPYFFGSHALAQIPYVTVELKHIYRQQDADFIDILAHIRTNNVTSEVLQKLNQRYIADFTLPDGEGWIRLTTHNNMANSYNQQKLEQLKGAAYTFSATVKGNFPEFSYPTDELLTVKVGAQVMFVKNDPSFEHEYYNGKIGVIEDFVEDTIVVRCSEDGTLIAVPRLTWENTKYVIDEETKEIRESVDGTFTQYPLRLAWAITVHKSQGLTFDHAVVDINHSFAHGQVYVALSRCRTLKGLVLANPLNMRGVITDHSVNAYIDKELQEARSSAEKLPQLRHDYFICLLDELFSFDQLLWDFRVLTRVVDEHLYTTVPDLLKDMKTAQAAIENDIIPVAQKFQKQYRQIISQCTNIYKDETLQQRLCAGSTYFCEQLQTILASFLEQKAVNISNQQVSTRYNNALDAFMLSLNVKLTTLTATTEEGFSVRTYLSSKAKAAIEDFKPKKTKQRTKNERRKTKDEEPEKPKRQKGDSERESLRLFSEGKSIKEIAELRNIGVATIETHLSHFIADGTLDINDFVSQQHQRFIRGVLRVQDRSYTLSDIKRLLPDDYSYFEIKAVIADINRKTV